MDQRTRVETPEIKPHMYGQLIYGTGAKICKGETIGSSANGFGKMTVTCKRVKLGHDSAHERKLETDRLGRKSRNHKTSGRKRAVNSSTLFSADFLDLTPKAQAPKAKTDKWAASN